MKKFSNRKRTIEDIDIVETKSARLKFKGDKEIIKDIGVNDKRGEEFDEYNKDSFINDLKDGFALKITRLFEEVWKWPYFNIITKTFAPNDANLHARSKQFVDTIYQKYKDKGDVLNFTIDQLVVAANEYRYTNYTQNNSTKEFQSLISEYTSHIMHEICYVFHELIIEDEKTISIFQEHDCIEMLDNEFNIRKLTALQIKLFDITRALITVAITDLDRKDSTLCLTSQVSHCIYLNACVMLSAEKADNAIAFLINKLDLEDNSYDHKVNDMLFDTMLFQALENGFIKTIKALINKNKYNASCIHTSPDGESVFHTLARCKKVESVKMILDLLTEKYGADLKKELNLIDNYGQPPLYIAINKSNTEVVKEFLRRGSEIKTPIKIHSKKLSADTALSLAYKKHNSELFKVIYNAINDSEKINSKHTLEIDEIISLYFPDKSQMINKLHIATMLGDPKIIKSSLLLNAKDLLNQKDSIHKKKPLGIAYTNSDTEAMKILIKEGASYYSALTSFLKEPSENENVIDIIFGNDIGYLPRKDGKEDIKEFLCTLLNKKYEKGAIEILNLALAKKNIIADLIFEFEKKLIDAYNADSSKTIELAQEAITNPSTNPSIKEFATIEISIIQDLIIKFSPKELIDIISLHKKILQQENDSGSETLSDIELQIASYDTDKFEFIHPAYRKDLLVKSDYLLVTSFELILGVIDNFIPAEFYLS